MMERDLADMGARAEVAAQRGGRRAGMSKGSARGRGRRIGGRGGRGRRRVRSSECDDSIDLFEFLEQWGTLSHGWRRKEDGDSIYREGRVLVSSLLRFRKKVAQHASWTCIHGADVRNGGLAWLT